MKDDLLSITELARLRKVTSETLRHYDRAELIKPEYVDPQTRYRYYSILQYERLGTIKELRALGLSVDEVKDYFDDRNLEKSLSYLKHRQKELQEEIQEKLLLSKVLSRKLHFLKDATFPIPVDTPVEFEFPRRHIITFGQPAGGPREHAFAFTKLEQYLTKVAPVLASDRIGVYCTEKILQPAEGFIPCVPMLFVEQDDIEDVYMETIEPGQYVCMRYHGTTGLEQYNPAFAQLTEYLETHALEVCGKIFQIYKIDKTVTDDPMEQLLEIQVPVAPVGSAKAEAAKEGRPVVPAARPATAQASEQAASGFMNQPVSPHRIHDTR